MKRGWSRAITAAAAFLAAVSGSLGKPRDEPRANHFQEIKLYTNLASWAFFAQHNCPGVRANTGRLLLLRIQANISDAEEAMVDEEMKARGQVLAGVLQKEGRISWCAGTWDLLGESGSVVKGILQREK